MAAAAATAINTEFNNLAMYSWTITNTNDTGNGVQVPLYSDKTVQMVGTWGSTPGAISLKGSLDGTNYEILTDADGNAITLTANGLVLVRENVLYIKPDKTTADASLDVDVTIMATNSKSQG